MLSQLNVLIRRSVHGQLLLALADGLSELLQHDLRVFPSDAGVGDADAVLQAGLAFGRDLLVACATLLALF